MELFNILTLLIVLSAAFGYVNVRFLKLPETIGLMVVAIVFSLVLISLNGFHFKVFDLAFSIFTQINFSELLLNVMLCFLLFAGAMHTDITLLRSQRNAIILFSVVGVLVSTLIIGTLLYAALMYFGMPVAFIWCLLFGALISPTDPIAVLGILTKANVPKKIEVTIVGESLFNDGIGVVLFVIILEVANAGIHNVSPLKVLTLFLQESGGGLLFGWLLGYVIFRLSKSIDHYQTEIMITLAGVMGGYYLARQLHVSGPLAMVVAGLFTGSHVKQHAMSDTTWQYVGKFWEVIDVIMNAILFLLIGLSISILHFDIRFLWASLFVIPLVLAARHLSILLPAAIFNKLVVMDRRTRLIMTWGGLRGGLSIAMSLSLSAPAPKEFIVFITYVIVVFSILVQGLTIEKLTRRLFSSRNVLPN